jgi:hypothetical protein
MLAFLSLLSAVVLPSMVQTRLLFHNAFSRGVLINDLLRGQSATAAAMHGRINATATAAVAAAAAAAAAAGSRDRRGRRNAQRRRFRRHSGMSNGGGGDGDDDSDGDNDEGTSLLGGSAASTAARTTSRVPPRAMRRTASQPDYGALLR